MSGRSSVYRDKGRFFSEILFAQKSDYFGKTRFFSSNFRKTNAKFQILPEFLCCYRNNSIFFGHFHKIRAFLKIVRNENRFTEKFIGFSFFRPHCASCEAQNGGVIFFTLFYRNSPIFRNFMRQNANSY